MTRNTKHQKIREIAGADAAAGELAGRPEPRDSRGMEDAMTRDEAAIRAITVAQESWQGADWTHYRRIDGRDAVDADGDFMECGHDEECCETCRDAKDAATAASEHGDAACRALMAGKLDDAMALVELARALENEWGDDPTWRQAAKALDELAAQWDAAKVRQ